jgi:hypothetical protein
MKSCNGCWFLALLVPGVLAILSGCTSRAPITYAVSLSDLLVEPAAVTTETPVRLKFKVICNRTGRSLIVGAEVVAEARRAGSPIVVTERVKCVPKKGQHSSAMPWEGAGQIELGKLPTGKQVITLALQPKGAGWTMPAPETITIEVKEAEK